MKAKDLAKILLENPEAEVVVASGNFEMNHADIPASNANIVKGKITSQTFRDAFDGGTYNSNVFRWGEESDQKFIKIS